MAKYKHITVLVTDVMVIEKYVRPKSGEAPTAQSDSTTYIPCLLLTCDGIEKYVLHPVMALLILTASHSLCVLALKSMYCESGEAPGTAQSITHTFHACY